ncbi:MAG: ROK family transcriptional regulator [Anaerolineaceae bacterium]|nr:ROK family transcriptional regulator [Anaerolineaceae bacterium]
MNYKKPTAQDLRRVNSAEILRKIYFDGPISRLEVSQQIGISPATVTNIVFDLLEKNLLVESGSKRSDGGRPSTLLTINPAYGHFIGCEVGESFINVELFDIRFTSCQKVSFSLNEERVEPEQVVEKISQGIQEVLSAAGIKENKVIGMGVGFPGLVDPVRGISVFTPNWGWHDVSLLKAIKRKHPFPMFLENGAKAMAMGEALFGAGKGVNNLTVLLVGTGVGCGIISDRSLFRGSMNNAGEIGHTIMELDGPVCRCGGHGCTEVYLGANGIIDRYRSLNADSDHPNRYDQIAYIQYILQKSSEGQPAAIQVVNETLRYLGVTLANLVNLLNPQLLLLGGWSGLLFGSRYLDKIKEQTAYYALAQSLAHTSIRLCELADDSVSKGAASLVLEHFFESGGELK